MAAAAVTVAAIGSLAFLRFDDDVRNLRSPSNQGVAVQERVSKAFGLSFNAMMIRVEAPDAATALDRVQRLAAGLDDLVSRKVISSYDSLANLLPPRQAQERNLAWIAAHRELTDPARVEQALAAAFTKDGLVPAAFDAGFATLGEALRPSGPISLERLGRARPVEQVVERSLAPDRHRRHHGDQRLRAARPVAARGAARAGGVGERRCTGRT